MQNLVIVESPTKARTLSRFLGEEFRVEASMGHVRDLPKGELGVDVEQRFKPRYTVPKDKEKRVSELKRLAKGTNSIYLATDPDREGEAIAWHIAELFGSSTNSKFIQRVVFHEITESAIREAFAHPRGINDNLVDSQQARRVLDRLVGYKLSPLLWRKVRRGLSAGRVQSVALRLVVEREREVEAFKPQEFWSITAHLAKDTQEFRAQLVTIADKKIQVGIQEEASRIVSDLRTQEYLVTTVTERQVTRQPDPPFMTSSLQQAAANRLGFSAKRTMIVAQRLYEEGFITYMRTDSVSLSRDAVANARAYIEQAFGKQYLPATARIYKTKQKLAQEAHEAIRPTDPGKTPVLVKGMLDRDRLRLYMLIWERLIACQMAQAVFDQTSVEIQAGPYGLRASGRVLRFDGWHALVRQDTGAQRDDEELTELPTLQRGDQLVLRDVEPEQHFTQPPARFSEASLIKALEEQGIGRPSTYAPILSTLAQRQYVEHLDRRLHPTPLGVTVSDFLVQYFPNVMDVHFTARLEDQLDDVAKGEQKWVPIVEQFYKPFATHLEQVQENAQRVKVAVEATDEVCPECGKQVVIRVGRFGKFFACSGFPTCRFTKAYVTKTDMVCPKCSAPIVMRRTRHKKNFYGCSNYPNCDFASWTKPKPELAANSQVAKV